LNVNLYSVNSLYILLKNLLEILF